MNRRSRREHLQQLTNEVRTMVFYEAPHKLPSTLEDLLAVLGDRRIALVRELTKIHEEVIRTSLAEAAVRYRTEAPRGEFVVIVEGRPPVKEAACTVEDAVSLAKELAADGLSASEAAKQAAAQTGIKKGEIYRRMAENGEE